MSLRLKKVLKTILKVGNQLNDGEDHLGFTLDSLLKLQAAKAFDKKTSVLQYVIVLIYRNDENCLLFPDDLIHVPEAARVSIDSIIGEKNNLKVGLESCIKHIQIIQDDDDKRQQQGVDALHSLSRVEVMKAFLERAREQIETLEQKIEDVKKKFSSVLAYFGEEHNMPSQDFFSTLTKFVKEFITERDNVERQRIKEAKRQARERLENEKNEKNAASLGINVNRRSSLGTESPGEKDKELAGFGTTQTSTPKKTISRRASII
jgi:hypothetical protein